MKYLLLFAIVATFFIASCAPDSSQDQASPITGNVVSDDVVTKDTTETPKESVNGDDVVVRDTTETPKESASGDDMKVKTFELTGEDYKFVMNGIDNPEIRVKQGDKVIVELTSTQGFHNFYIDELLVRSNSVITGETTTVEFVASEKGTYNYFCNVGAHRRQGMEGVFIVE